MKRLTSILLAAALLLTMGSALAEGGNAVIARSGYDGFIDTIRRAARSRTIRGRRTCARC